MEIIVKEDRRAKKKKSLCVIKMDNRTECWQEKEKLKKGNNI